MRYRPLSVRDLPQARRLWETAFDDPATFVEWYFNMRFPPEQARGLFRQERLLSMAQAVPYRLFLRGQWIQAVYIVGLATDPAARGEGLATLLLQNMMEELYHAGLKLTILMPAVPLFYRKRGWEFTYQKQTTRLIIPESGKLAGQLVSSPSVNYPVMETLYQKAFQSAHGRLARTEKDWHDLIHDYVMDNGSLEYYCDQNGHIHAYILYQATPELMKIRELAVDDPGLIKDVLGLFGVFHPQQPIDWQRWSGQESPFQPGHDTIEPLAMARIVNLQHILESIRYPVEAVLDLRFSLYDPLIRDNRHAYRWQVHSGVGRLTKLPDHPAYPRFSISDLTTWVMGEPRNIPAEIEKLLPRQENYLNDLF